MKILEISYYALFVALLLLSIVFLLTPVPTHDGIKKYTISLRLLAFSFFLLAIYCILKLFCQIEIFSFPFLVVSVTQAHLLSISHINMLNPHRVTARYVTRQIAPLIIFCVLYVIVSLFEDHVYLNYDNLAHAWIENGELRFNVILRLLFMAYYLSLFFYYIKNFFKESRDFQNNIDDFSSYNNIVDEGLKSIRLSFLFVAAIGTTSLLISACMSQDLLTVLNFFMLILYCIVGLMYLHYPKVFYTIYDSYKTEDDESLETLKTNEKEARWNDWKNVILQEKLYCISGITLRLIAIRLGTNVKTLSICLHTFETCNFNAFINQLRIEEAKNIIETNNELTMAEVGVMVGYSDPSNFCRYFKEYTYMTPTEWKRNRP